MSSRGTCWEGYVQKGMKKKGNRMVPNCVPAGGMKEGKACGTAIHLKIKRKIEML